MAKPKRRGQYTGGGPIAVLVAMLWAKMCPKSTPLPCDECSGFNLYGCIDSEQILFLFVCPIWWLVTFGICLSV